MKFKKVIVFIIVIAAFSTGALSTATDISFSLNGEELKMNNSPFMKDGFFDVAAT